MLTDLQLERYRRQTILPQLGTDGQERLLASSVLIIGAGGLGSPVALYLAASGVGRIGLIDADCVDLSNLQRQVIHSEEWVGRPKVESAAARMRAINSDITVEPICGWFGPENGPELVRAYDFVVDATDSFSCKGLINDLCVAAGRAFSHGAISCFQGYTFTWVPGAPCYRCLFENEPMHTDPVGPLGVVPGVIGMLQATEAVKYLAGIGSLLTGTLLTADMLTMDFQKVRFGISSSCPHHAPAGAKSPAGTGGQ